jgi:hypothetical protein
VEDALDARSETRLARRIVRARKFDILGANASWPLAKMLDGEVGVHGKFIVIQSARERQAPV